MTKLRGANGEEAFQPVHSATNFAAAQKDDKCQLAIKQVANKWSKLDKRSWNSNSLYEAVSR